MSAGSGWVGVVSWGAGSGLLFVLGGGWGEGSVTWGLGSGLYDLRQG